MKLSRRWRASAAVVGLAGVLVLTGCASGATSDGSASSEVSVSSGGSGASGAASSAGGSIAAPTAGNRAVGRAEAARLMRLVSVPAGAAPHRPGSPSISGPAAVSNAQQPIGSSDTVALSRQWSLPMTFTEVLTWLTAQHPAGLRPSGSASSSGPPGVGHTTGVSWAAPDRPDVWVNAALYLTATSVAPRQTLLRADAQVVWLDPKPLAVDQGRPRAPHLAVGSPCPTPSATLTEPAEPANEGADLTRRLLPDSDPIAAMICSAPQQFPGSAVRRMLDSDAAGTLARAVRALSLFNAGPWLIPCPPPARYPTLIAFRYSGRPDVELSVSPGGCPIASNGDIYAEGGAGFPALEAAITAAIG